MSKIRIHRSEKDDTFEAPHDPRRPQKPRKSSANSLSNLNDRFDSNNGKKDEGKFRNQAEITFMNDRRYKVFDSKEDFETGIL